MNAVVDVGMGLTGTDGSIRHQVEEGGNGRGPEQRAAPESGVTHTSGGAADRTSEPASHRYDPVDEDGSFSVEDRPRHHPLSEAITVHPNPWEDRDRATVAERTTAVDVRRQRKLGW